VTQTNVIKTLGAAELDTKQLTVDLVAAIKEPRQALIDREKTKAEVAISNTALLKSALSAIKETATELGSVAKLNKLSLSSSDTTSVGISPGTGLRAAREGSYTLSVEQLAQPQRNVSVPGYASGDAIVATDEDLQMRLTLGGITESIAITKDVTTASGLVSAINQKRMGVTARLVNTADGSASPFKIVLEGPQGAVNSFSVSFVNAQDDPAISPPVFSNATANGGQAALDAVFVMNGLRIQRSSNVVTDVVDGINLNLRQVSPAPVALSVAYDASALTGAVANFVESYNLLTEFIVRATGPNAKGDDIAGSLRGDSAVKSIRNSIRSKLTAESTGKSGAITHWSSLGVSLDRNGVLEFDSAKFITEFQKSPEDAIKALSNNAAAPYFFSGSPSGLAGDLAVAAHQYLSSTGAVSRITSAYESKLDTIETKQLKLDEYVERVTAQYDRQFAALNSVLAQFKATSERLKSSLNFNNKD
jgi:flagellar hook-associated protein 2